MGNRFQQGPRLGDYFLGRPRTKTTFLDEIDEIIDVMAEDRAENVDAAEAVETNDTTAQDEPNVKTSYSDDEEAAWLRKGRRACYGYKIHVATDSRDGFLLGGNSFSPMGSRSYHGDGAIFAIQYSPGHRKATSPSESPDAHSRQPGHRRPWKRYCAQKQGN